VGYIYAYDSSSRSRVDRRRYSCVIRIGGAQIVIDVRVIWTTRGITQICNAPKSALIVVSFPFIARHTLVTDIPDTKVGEAIEGSIGREEVIRNRSRRPGKIKVEVSAAGIRSRRRGVTPPVRGKWAEIRDLNDGGIGRVGIERRVRRESVQESEFEA